MVIKRKKRTALDKFSGWCFKLLKKSFIGKYFTSYEKANEKFQKITKKEPKYSHVPRKNRIARILENNVFAKIIPTAYHFFLRVKVSNYATALVAMGAVSLTMYILNYLGFLSLGGFDATIPMFILPALLIIIPFPYLFSRKSTANAFLTNKLFSFVVFSFLGADDAGVKDAAQKPRISSTMLSFLLGAGLGALSYILQKPEYILFTISIILFAYIVFRTPEIGVVLTIFTLPFVNIFITKISIIYIIFCYLIKLILHKRIITFEYFDIWPTLAIIVMIFTGLNYQDPASSLPKIASNLIILVSYFIISNLIRSKDWFKRCIFALTSSAFICAMVGIVQAVLGTVYAYFPIIGDFSMYENNVTSIFSTYNAFSQYMIIAIPFALVHIFAERKDMSKIGGFFISVVLATGLLVARSKSAFLGIFVAVLLLLIIYNRNFIYLALVAIVTPIVLYFSLRENGYVMNFIRTFDFFRDFDPYGKLLYLKDGLVAWLDAPFGKGIGGGAGEYDSFFIQLLTEYGIIMVIAFAACAIVFAKMVFSYCAKEKGRHRKIYCSAGFCALLGIFFTGAFANVWGDEKIMLFSIICMALSFAYIKIEREAQSRLEVKNDYSQAFVEIELADEEYREYVLNRKYVRAPKKMKSKMKSKSKNYFDSLNIKTKKNKYLENDDDEDDEDRV